MRLFIALFLDEDVPILIADLLRARGYTAVTTVEAGRRGRSDPEQLAYAASMGYALLTHNRGDFEELARAYLAEGRDHYGIIIATRHPPHEVVRRLLLILDQVTAEELRGQLRYI